MYMAKLLISLMLAGLLAMATVVPAFAKGKPNGLPPGVSPPDGCVAAHDIARQHGNLGQDSCP